MFIYSPLYTASTALNVQNYPTHHCGMQHVKGSDIHCVGVKTRHSETEKSHVAMETWSQTEALTTENLQLLMRTDFTRLFFSSSPGVLSEPVFILCRGTCRSHRVSHSLIRSASLGLQGRAAPACSYSHCSGDEGSLSQHVVCKCFISKHKR